MKKFGIGLLGFGTVGAGVVEGLQKHGDLIAKRTGLELALRRVADLDLTRDRGVTLAPGVLTQDAMGVIDDPKVDIVVELIGGTQVARELMLKALRANKPVITANKALLAEHGDEIFLTAKECNTDLFFEASVGGGIPVIRALREGLIANHVEAIYGIVNGTCNYILTQMERGGRPFEDVLADAQRQGFAELDPGLDIDGIDTAHKAIILASLAYGFTIPMGQVACEGIRGLANLDLQYALDLGYRIKLLAVIQYRADGIEISVHPALVPLEHMLASVDGVYNGILVRGDVVGDTLYYGRGAGRAPTASAVLGDIVDAARNLAMHSARRVPAFPSYEHYGRIRVVGDTDTRYYLRLALLDKPGIIARVAHILGTHQISIAALIQKEARSGEHVPVIILTHVAKEQHFRDALREIDAMDVVGAPTVRLRIEDFT